MRLLKTIAGLRAYLRGNCRVQEIGLVPTMGALHAGHQSLLERAIAENDVAIASIFVNPLQFGPQEDLHKYPRTLEQDCQLCEKLGIDVVFAPSPAEMGIGALETESRGKALGVSVENPASNVNIPNALPVHPIQNPKSKIPTKVVPPAEMMSVLCGPYRPGHFQGVATIVTKLLNIVQPTRAYFGEKDAQQLAIIRRLVRDLNLPVEIRVCTIVREASGLALSSRNQYLTPAQKEQATILFRSLQAAQQAFKSGERESSTLIAIAKDKFAAVPEVKLEYLQLVDPHTLVPLERIETEGLLAIAAYVGSTRLIDNIVLRDRQPIIAIDGPAGAGKSTVTRCVAEALGFFHLDTGAMYRAVTWLVLQAGIAVEDEPAIAELLRSATLEFRSAGSDTGMRVSIDQKDVTEAIRTPAITANVSAISRLPAVRHALVKQQQHWGQQGGIVAEGRDIGTHVFPNAELKIFLTASERERARRRMQDLKAQGESDLRLEQIERDIQQRDFLDSTRKIAPLRKAPDAIEIVTDDLSIEEVTQAIIECYKQSFSTQMK